MNKNVGNEELVKSYEVKTTFTCEMNNEKFYINCLVGLLKSNLQI